MIETLVGSAADQYPKMIDALQDEGCKAHGDAIKVESCLRLLKLYM